MPCNPKAVPRFLLLVLFVLTFSGCDHPNRLELLKYKKTILEERAQKNKAFKFSQNSPIAATERWQFKELPYYPVDSTYAVQATFSKMPVHEEFVIQTSSGAPRVYVTVGRFDFTLQGNPLQLMAYQEKEWLSSSQHRDTLFVPFTDLTTGETTYGAGRYLDLDLPVDKQVTLDFNRAYNPYCAYNHMYSCPIPPRENYLPVRIEAGEKK